MLVVEPGSNRDDLSTPRLPAIRLVPTNEQNGHPARVECEQNSQVTSSWTQFLHVGVTRSLHAVDKWSPESGSLLFQDFYRRDYPIPRSLIEFSVPLAELVGVLNL